MASAAQTSTAHQGNIAGEINAILTEPSAEVDNLPDGDPLRGWTQEVEFRVFRMMDKCDSSKRLHEESAKYYDKRQSMLSVSVLMMSFVVTVVGGATDLFGASYRYIYGFLGSLLTLMSGLAVTLKYQESATKHRAASQKFYELYQTVDYQIMFPSERSSAPHFFRFINTSFGQINGRAPRPPDSVRRANAVPLSSISVVNNRDDLPFADTAPSAPNVPGDVVAAEGIHDFTDYTTHRRREYLSETD